MSSNNRDEWGVTNLRLAFPKKKTMFFKDLTFHYRKGEKILLLGPSGCGKSTLLEVLSGLVPNSIELPMKAEKISIPEHWGYIFQNPDTQFCMPYVDEEIAFVLENRQVERSEMPALIARYLHAAGLDFESPHRLINELSGGMKQRLATAGVLALEPDVLFLDEPTAMLDPEGTKQLWNTMRRVAEGRTVLVVEHKIDEVIDFVDRVVVFDDCGRIVRDGAKDEVLRASQKELNDAGIWYPGVWEARDSARSIPKVNHNTVPLLELNHFHVFRKRQLKVAVPHLTVGEGEWVCIIGENGAGKSTLLEGIMGLIPFKGTCRWHIENMEKNVAFVFQNPEYQFVTDQVDDEMGFDLTLKNVPEKELNERVNAGLDRFSLTKQRDNHPFQLSVGQKRRLSVASSLIDRPKAVLLDEPTFGQDARNTFALLNIFEQIRSEGSTVIMVTHEMEVVKRFATRVIAIKDGAILSDTPTGRSGGRSGEASDGRPVEKHRQMVF